MPTTFDDGVFNGNLSCNDLTVSGGATIATLAVTASVASRVEAGGAYLGVLATGDITTTPKNNLAVSGLANASILQLLTSGGPIVVTGLVPPAQPAGFCQLLIIHNLVGSAGNFVLNNEDAGSAAANRFVNRGGANVTLVPGDSAQYFYDPTDLRWVQV